MDADQDGFTIRGDWSAPGSPSIVGHYRLADFGKLAVARLSAGLPLIVNDNLAELAPEEAASFPGHRHRRAPICMPLVKEGRLTALMAIHDKAPRVWSASRTRDDHRSHRALVGACRARARRGRGPGQRVAVPHLRADDAQSCLDSRADGQLDWFNDRSTPIAVASRGRSMARAGPSSSIPTISTMPRSAGSRSVARAATTRPSSGCAATMASWRWHLSRACRSGTPTAVSSAGSAPIPMSTTRRMAEARLEENLRAAHRRARPPLAGQPGHAGRRRSRSGLWSTASIRPGRACWAGPRTSCSAACSEWLVHPDDLEKTRAELQQLAAGDASLEFVNRLRARRRQLSDPGLVGGADATIGSTPWHATSPSSAPRRRPSRRARGAAAPGAEDGGGRPAHRRHRA